MKNYFLRSLARKKFVTICLVTFWEGDSKIWQFSGNVIFGSSLHYLSFATAFLSNIQLAAWLYFLSKGYQLAKIYMEIVRKDAKIVRLMKRLKVVRFTLKIVRS